METKFQTSFIPRKPMAPTIGGTSIGTTTPKHSGVVSVYMSIAVLLFILSIGALGGAYFAERYYQSQQVKLSGELTALEKGFSTADIELKKQQKIQIDLAGQLLKSHLAMSEIFEYLKRLTIQKVRFLSLEITAPENDGDDIKMSLNGYSADYESLAFQTRVLANLDDPTINLRNVVKNPIISNPVKDPDSTVAFGFTATIDPSKITYERILNSAEQNANQ